MPTGMYPCSTILGDLAIFLLANPNGAEDEEEGELQVALSSMLEVTCSPLEALLPVH